MVADPAQQLDGSRWLKPVAVLSRHFMMQDGFTILKMEAADPQRGDIGVDRLRAADEAQQNVSGYVVAERNGQSEKRSRAHRQRPRDIFPAADCRHGEGCGPREESAPADRA